jgi:hypothetical protein
MIVASWFSGVARQVPRTPGSEPAAHFLVERGRDLEPILARASLEPKIQHLLRRADKAASGHHCLPGDTVLYPAIPPSTSRLSDKEDNGQTHVVSFS